VTKERRSPKEGNPKGLEGPKEEQGPKKKKRKKKKGEHSKPVPGGQKHHNRQKNGRKRAKEATRKGEKDATGAP